MFHPRSRHNISSSTTHSLSRFLVSLCLCAYPYVCGLFSVHAAREHSPTPGMPRPQDLYSREADAAERRAHTPLCGVPYFSGGSTMAPLYTYDPMLPDLIQGSVWQRALTESASPCFR